MDRRDFVKQSGIILGGVMLPPFNAPATDGFSVQFFCPRWGATDSWDSFCKRVKDAGYDGVETALPLEANEKAAAIEAISKHGLKYIGQYHQSIESNAKDNAAGFEKYIRNMADAFPVFINSQTGRDWFSFEENKLVVDTAFRLTKETNIKIVHETHRGKMAFAAHVTQQYLRKIPEMRLTLDISHWCNVHESLLQDQQEAVTLALDHTDHIHSRIGHSQGAQVNDPRAPEWTKMVEAHLKWWDYVVAAKRKAGQPVTITTEFGPSGYMPVLPYTQQPVASQWDINVHILNMLKKRYTL